MASAVGGDPARTSSSATARSRREKAAYMRGRYRSVTPRRSLEPREHLVEELFLLLEVDREAPRGRARRLGPGHHAQLVVGADQPLQSPARERPRAHVLGLLLQPHDLRRLLE